jgi:hypothetical protein
MGQVARAAATPRNIPAVRLIGIPSFLEVIHLPLTYYSADDQYGKF